MFTLLQDLLNLAELMHDRQGKSAFILERRPGGLTTPQTSAQTQTCSTETSRTRPHSNLAGCQENIPDVIQKPYYTVHASSRPDNESERHTRLHNHYYMYQGQQNTVRRRISVLYVKKLSLPQHCSNVPETNTSEKKTKQSASAVVPVATSSASSNMIR